MRRMARWNRGLVVGSVTLAGICPAIPAAAQVAIERLNGSMQSY